MPYLFGWQSRRSITITPNQSVSVHDRKNQTVKNTRFVLVRVCVCVCVCVCVLGVGGVRDKKRVNNPPPPPPNFFPGLLPRASGLEMKMNGPLADCWLRSLSVCVCVISQLAIAKTLINYEPIRFVSAAEFEICVKQSWAWIPFGIFSTLLHQNRHQHRNVCIKFYVDNINVLIYGI